MDGIGSPLTRALLVLVALLLGIVFGQLGGILVAVGGATLAADFITGGVAFAGTVTLVLLIEKSLGLL